MTLKTFNDYVKLYQSWGVGFMPLFPRTKQPCLSKWKEFAGTPPAQAQIDDWRRKYWNPKFWRDVWEGKKEPELLIRWKKALANDWEKAGVADQLKSWSYDSTLSVAVIASPSTGFCLVDIEDISLLNEKDQLAIIGTEWQTPVVSTGRPHGHHIYLRIPAKYAINKKGVNGEIRAKNQYVAAPPSVHPNASPYRFLKIFEPKQIGEAEAQEFMELLVSMISATKDDVLELAKTVPVTAGARSDWIFGLTSYYKSQGLSLEAVLEKLMAVPVCASKIEDQGEDWWEEHQWNKVDTAGKGSIGLIMAAAKKSQVVLTEKIVEKIKAVDAEFSNVYVRPSVTLTTDLSEGAEDTLEVLYKYNDYAKLRLFQRGGEMVRVRVIENDKVKIETLSESALRFILGKAAMFQKTVKVKDHFEWEPMKPPTDVTKEILTMDHWNLPVITGIINTPVMRIDGSILSKPGFDPATGFWLSTDLELPEIPENPTQEDAKRAAKYVLDELLSDFPLDGIVKADGKDLTCSSRTNALAAFLTPVIRPMIDGPIPIALVTKPAPGTGASKLMDLISIVVTGETMPTASPPETGDEAEWRKLITGMMRDGSTLVCLDNIACDLQADALSRALSTRIWKDRTLTKPDVQQYPQNACWYANGNHLKLAGDLPRRGYLIELDALMARPWTRDPKKFGHPDIIKWLKENRADLLAALLTMGRAWVAAGRPDGKDLPTIGGFDEWVKIVGGILEYAGVEKFLGNLSKLYEEVDIGGDEWGTFLRVWREWREVGVSSSEVLDEIRNPHTKLGKVVPVELAEMVKFHSPGDAVKIGKYLRNKVNVRHGGLTLISERDKSDNTTIWTVVEAHDSKLV
jgi:hypothetical protein